MVLHLVSVAYNSIIRVLLSRNKLYEEMPLLEEMSERGFMVESSTLSMLCYQIISTIRRKMKFLSE